MMSLPVRTAARPFRDLYYVRLATTGLSFLLFGIGGVLLGIVAVPLLLLVPGGRPARRMRVRRMIRVAFRLFIGFMHHTGAISYSFSGAERLGRPGQLIVANHPSLIDIVLLIGFIRHAGCVVKREAWRNPAMVIVVSAAGYVPNAPTDVMIERASELLTSGECLIMFPEGTRTVPHRPAHFHRGAASVALRGASIVTPVFIDVEPPSLSKSMPWYRLPVPRAHFALRVGGDIDPAPFRTGSLPIASRTFNEHLVATYAVEAGGN
ncbi:MAG: lysophospholipid acyltransferase family protein [Steroidobacteraceae bacterium]